MRPRSLTHIALVLCLGLCAVWQSHASGQREERLADVERLIEAKEYGQALQLLVVIERDNPDMRDKTREYMSRIYALQARGDILMEQILDTLAANDVEKALSLITELETLDPKATTKIATAKKGVVFTVNKNYFNKLMDDAAKKLAEKKYAEAITLYVEPLKYPDKIPGFDLHRKEFIEAGYPDMVQTDIVKRAAEEVEISEAAALAEKTTSGSAASASAAAAMTPMGDPALASFRTALADIRSAVDRESSLQAFADGLDKAGKAIAQSTADKRVEYYIQYMGILCYGRTGRTEGIIAAIRMMWEDAAAAVSNDAIAGLDAAFAKGLGLYDSGNYSGSLTAFSDVPNRSLAVLDALALRGAAVQPDGSWSFTAEDAKKIGALLGEAASAAEKSAESRALTVLGRLKRELSALEPANAGIAEYRTLRASLKTRIGEGESYVKEWDDRTRMLSGQAGIVSSVQEAQKAAEAMKARFTSYIADLKARDLEYAVLIAKDGSKGFEPALKNSMAQKIRAEDLINGTENGVAVEENPPKHPSAALVILQAEIGNLQALQKDIALFVKTWKSDVSHVSGSNEIKALITAAESVSANANGEIALMQTDSKTAKAQHERAVEQKRIGDQYFDRAAAMAKKDPEEARNLLDSSYTSYGLSLKEEEDESIQRRIATEGAQLLAQIETALNARLIDDVERLISAGIKLFTSGDSMNAYQKFSQADAKWQEKHPGEAYSYLLTYYLDLSRNASSATGSREIQPTDASYGTVSSYLSLANQNYQEAERLIKGGKAQEAAKYLESAKQNVDSVLSLFPYNRAAVVLDLKILKVADEKAFPAKLKAIENGFIKDSKSPTIDQKRAAYLGLKNIQEFLPNDAELARIIKVLGQEIGAEAKPISQANINESAKLTRQAEANFNPRKSETWDSSIKILDSALVLNPNNVQAQSLRRKILEQSGKAPPMSVSPKVLAEYSRIVDMFNKKDYQGAKMAMDTLLRDPKNTGITLLRDLEKRINSRLGI